MEKHNTKENFCGVPVRTFHFEFGADEGVCSASFRGVIPELEIRCMLKSLHKQTYTRCTEAIHSYLDTHQLEYWDFNSVRTRLEHDAVMKTADSLLHAGTCECMDKRIGGADCYYSIMDYQRLSGRECCEGCYYAVSRTLSRQEYPYEYHIICQTFQYDVSGCSEHSCFAIRRNEGERCLHTLDHEDGQPILSTFGCVDLMGLLINITETTTKQQAAGLANK